MLTSDRFAIFLIKTNLLSHGPAQVLLNWIKQLRTGKIIKLICLFKILTTIHVKGYLVSYYQLTSIAGDSGNVCDFLIK